MEEKRSGRPIVIMLGSAEYETVPGSRNLDI